MSRLSAAIKQGLLWPAALLLRALFANLGRSWRFEIDNREVLAELIADPRPIIISFWHHQLFPGAYFLLRELHRKGIKLTLLASHSRDGELVVRFARPLKIHTVRGSASKGGQAAVRALYRSIVRERASPLLVPDGPRGPRFECKLGAVLLAQFARVPILPLGLAAEREWQLGSWDRMFIPKWRSRVAVSVGALQTVPRHATEVERESGRVELEETLNRLRREAETAVGEKS